METPRRFSGSCSWIRRDGRDRYEGTITRALLRSGDEPSLVLDVISEGRRYTVPLRLDSSRNEYRGGFESPPESRTPGTTNLASAALYQNTRDPEEYLLFGEWTENGVLNFWWGKLAPEESRA